MAAQVGDLLGEHVDPVLAAGDQHDGRALGGEPAGGLPGSDPVSDLAATAAVYAKFTAEHGIGFDLIFAAELRGHDDQDLTDAGRAVMDPPLRAALSLTDGDAKAALTLVSRAFAAAHGYATLWRSGLYVDRHATVEDLAIEAAAVARTLAMAGRVGEGRTVNGASAGGGVAGPR